MLALENNHKSNSEEHTSLSSILNSTLLLKTAWSGFNPNLLLQWDYLHPGMPKVSGGVADQDHNKMNSTKVQNPRRYGGAHSA